jgi:PhnB protein
MTDIHPYLTLPGTASDAIELYKRAFGVEPEMVQRFRDMPGADPAEPGGERVLHASFKLENALLMLSDAPVGQDDTVVFGTQTHVSVHGESREEADRMFALLAEGGEVVMPLEDQFWGDYFGMCTDRFGVRWMVSGGEGAGA